MRLYALAEKLTSVEFQSFDLIGWIHNIEPWQRMLLLVRDKEEERRHGSAVTRGEISEMRLKGLDGMNTNACREINNLTDVLTR